MFSGATQNDPSEIEKQVRALGWWYQDFELPCGIRTGTGEEPSYLPETRWKLFEPHVPADLQGKTVLDVGGNAGYFSIQMMLRGAKRCVLVEPYIEFVRQAEFAARQFGVELEIVNEDIHTYCLTTSERFDHVLFLGLFYHLKYPGLVLDRLAEMTIGRMYFQSHLIGAEQEKPPPQPNYARGTGTDAKGEARGDDALLEDPAFPRLLFIETLYNGDPTNWWIPNYAALEPMLRSAGLKVIARPHPQVLVAEPEVYLGKAIYGNLVFPRYGKQGKPTHPGPQQVDLKLWAELLKKVEKGNR